jgi:ABC-2 type transport system permease protein
MTSPSSAIPHSPFDEPVVPVKQVRPLYWSIRRELWENRSIYLAPLVIAAVFLSGFLLSTIGLPHRRRALLLMDLSRQRAAIDKPYDVAAILLIITAFLVGVFYCLDALHGERRDRSILFWKSLPVSDSKTVLSKAGIPLVVLPLLTFAITLATQLVMLLWTNTLLLLSGMEPTTSAQLPLFGQTLILLYGLVVFTLWYAPLYCWLLLLSAWARRAVFLWAALPFLAIAAFEKITLNTSHFGAFIRNRFAGPMVVAFRAGTDGRIDSVTQLTPGNFLITPGLWLGLIVAAALIAATVRLRRNREPI